MATLIANIDGFGLTTQPLGPYQAAGKLWAALTDNVAFAVRMFSSSDNGTTWAEADAAHRPSTIAVSNNVVGSIISGSVISVALVAVGGALNLITFNCTTALWGTRTTGGPTVSTLIPSVLLQERSDSSLVIAYGIDVNGASNVNCAFVVFSAGAFGSGTNISPSITTDDPPFGIVLGASDRVHIFTGSPIATGAINHTCINSDNSVGPRRTIATHYKNPEFDAPYMQPAYDGTSLILPVTSDPASGAFILSAAEAQDPTPWTQTNLNDAVTFFFFGTFLQAALFSAGVDYAFFTGSGGAALNEHSTGVGSWGAAQTVYTSTGHVASISAGIVNGGVALVFSEKPTAGGSEATRTMFLQLTSASTNKLEISLFGTKRFGKQPQAECTELPEPKPVKLIE